MLPHLSETVRCVVEGPSTAVEALVPAGHEPAAVEGAGISRCDRALRGPVPDQGPPLRSETVGEQACERYVDVGWIPKVLAPVGERVSGGFEIAVERIVAGEGRHRVSLQDVERLTDGRTAGGRRSHTVHLHVPCRSLRSGRVRWSGSPRGRFVFIRPGRTLRVVAAIDRRIAIPCPRWPGRCVPA